MLITVVNHECNEQAAQLVSGFKPYAQVIAIDSGSRLNSEDDGVFDIQLPNVYYSGLLNEVCKLLETTAESEVFFICSDVRFSNYQLAAEYVKEAFADNNIGVYAPACQKSSHPQMYCHRTNELRDVVFVEGFCFAVRQNLLKQLCPIDTEVNYLGWGLDVYLGYLAFKDGYRVVVDDRIIVEHPYSSGYDSQQARLQRNAWFALQSQEFHIFTYLTGSKLIKNAFGVYLCRLFFVFSNLFQKAIEDFQTR